jgi:hypothetical protein
MKRAWGEFIRSGSRGSRLAVMIISGWLCGAGCLEPMDDSEGKPGARASNGPRRDQAVIEAARRDLLREENLSLDEDKLTPAPVLFVNGDAITVEDILKWSRPKLSQLAKEAPPEELRGQRIELLRAEVRARAERQVLSQEARVKLGAQGLERLEAFVDGRIREIVNQDHGGRESRYREWLATQGITPEEDRDRILREMLVVAYLQRTIGPKVTEPTRREIQRFHDEYVATQEAQRKRRMGLIDIPHGDRDVTGRRMSPRVSLSDARGRAREALSRLRAGEEFANVAARYSQGINAPEGGDWGWVTREGVRPRWQPAVDRLYAMAEGAVSEILQTDDALFIVHCAEIEPIDIPSFEELQPKLIEAFKQQQYEMLTRERVSELFAKADVRPENPGRFLLAVVNAAE